MESLYLIGLAVLALFAFVLAIVLFNFFGLWLRARIANAPVNIGKMIGMRLRKVPVGMIVDNGIGAKVKARVTVRSHLDRFVGGATEETIIARVGEGIVSAIGSADSYKDVLENPDRISKAVLAKGLDSNTAFEILSIDIADVDV